MGRKNPVLDKLFETFEVEPKAPEILRCHEIIDFIPARKMTEHVKEKLEMS